MIFQLRNFFRKILHNPADPLSNQKIVFQSRDPLSKQKIVFKSIKRKTLYNQAEPKIYLLSIEQLFGRHSVIKQIPSRTRKLFFSLEIFFGKHSIIQQNPSVTKKQFFSPETISRRQILYEQIDPLTNKKYSFQPRKKFV